MQYFVKNSKDIVNTVKTIAESLNKILATSKNGVDISITEHKIKRSTQQNDFYFLNCRDIARFLNGSGECWGFMQLPYTEKVIHETNKLIFGHDTTTKMSVKEFCQYMESVFALWQEHTHYCWTPLESVNSYIERTGLIDYLDNER